LGTGVGGFSVTQAAKIMIQAARDFEKSPTFNEIGFVLFDQSSFQAFQRELEHNPED
jgi:O-acetyl-ADP-ribose deacetylase (regulator of RNase III)